jgi:hypothetical protein
MIFKGAHRAGDLNHREAHRRKPPDAISGSEDFAFHDPCAVANRDELHGLTSLLQMGAADDDETADVHCLMWVAVKLGNRVVGKPVELCRAPSVP